MVPELGIRLSHVVLAIGLSVFAVPNALARPSLVGTVGTLVAAFLASFLFVWGLSRMIALFRSGD
ncbi:MAG: hypothetical protein V5A37_09020 [Halobacteriales archaeon]|jgi:hypothetical protein